MMSRREFVGVLATATCGVARVPSLAAQDDELSRTRDGLPWLREAQRIVSRIRIPTFPDRTISGLEAGGKPDGVTDCRAKFQSVIDQLNAAGGGQLSLPSGTWLSNGPLHLKSNVRLHLSAEARLEFSGSPEHYLPVVLTRWEGTEVYGPSPLIYAYQSVNVAVTGSGVIVGHGGEVFDTWREKQADDQQLLRKMGAEGVAVHERTFGAGRFLRPVMMQFFACRNVLVDGIALTDMPFWGIHPVFSHSVTIRGVRIDSRYVNSDGIDPDSSTDVLIERCVLRTGNDCVSIKSGRDEDGWRLGRPSDGIVVRNCDMTGTSPALGAGVSIGSEMSAGVRNVYIHDCIMRTVPFGVNIKSNLDRGGSVEHVRMGNCRVQRSNSLVQLTTAFGGYRGGQRPPLFRDIRVENVDCDQTDIGLSVVGARDAPVQQLTLDNVTIGSAKRPVEVKYVRGLRARRVRIGGSDVVVPSNADD